MDKIAVCHPGMIGDALYSLPSAKWISEKYDCQIDFWTSEYCAPMKSLVEYQSYIDEFCILESYVLKGNGPGFQPWRMEIPKDGYSRIYQCGFQSNPSMALHDHIALSVGAPLGLPVRYEFEDVIKQAFNLSTEMKDKPKVIVAPKGETTYKDLFLQLIADEDFDVVQIGAHGDEIHWRGIFTGYDFLETAGMISQAHVYVGLMSSNLVLANGFPNLIKIAPHDGKSWDMRHVIYSDTNFYPVNPTYEQLKELIYGEVQQVLRTK